MQKRLNMFPSHHITHFFIFFTNYDVKTCKIKQNHCQSQQTRYRSQKKTLSKVRKNLRLSGPSKDPVNVEMEALVFREFVQTNMKTNRKSVLLNFNLDSKNQHIDSICPRSICAIAFASVLHEFAQTKMKTNKNEKKRIA